METIHNCLGYLYEGSRVRTWSWRSDEQNDGRDFSQGMRRSGLSPVLQAAPQRLVGDQDCRVQSFLGVNRMKMACHFVRGLESAHLWLEKRWQNDIREFSWGMTRPSLVLFSLFANPYISRSPTFIHAVGNNADGHFITLSGREIYKSKKSEPGFVNINIVSGDDQGR
ncbi:hypothetical protein CPB83DRAFT_834994 [Crepidotus variabilis]|uniref:Uncharacterized protein n=1 Tax=Crepidotus variabilis TaxID=179855 RepID=A0A9P6EIA8_9AGAR|nr:hypothetical protein CPB83DRAFT_834994 [Crepidotus variabilis]